jgi:hypothetical protein
VPQISQYPAIISAARSHRGSRGGERGGRSPINLAGKRFGRWTVVGYAGQSRWHCECACGAHRVVHGQTLREGRSRSHGCLRNESNSARARPPKIDLRGQRFGRLVVTAYAGRGRDYRGRWRCGCACGGTAVVDGNSLRRGLTRSCGCLRREVGKLAGSGRRTHGMWGTREYKTWHGILQRCRNPQHPDFENYGGRGITVEWLSFEEYFADTGPKPEGLSLDRPNNNGPYGPNNWRWADAKVQSRNQRPRRKRAALKRRQPSPLDIPF